MRSDAARNRGAIVEAARAALDAGRTPSMADVARAAEVGQGTLYRHFRAWPELVMAVHRDDVDRLVEAAPLLLEQHSAAEALRQWLRRLAEYGRIKHGLSGALHADLAEEGRAPVVGAIQLLLTAGVADGTLRGDLDGEDVLLLVGFLWRLEPIGDRDARAARLLDATLAALRA